MYKKTLIFNYCITNIEMWCWWKVSSVNPSLGYMVRLVLRLISMISVLFSIPKIQDGRHIDILSMLSDLLIKKTKI